MDVTLDLVPGNVIGTRFLLVAKNIRVDLRQVFCFFLLFVFGFWFLVFAFFFFFFLIGK